MDKRRVTTRPSANVDLVRSIFAAWERGDYSAAEWANPEIEFVFAGEGLAPGSFTGLPAMAERWREFLSAWEGIRVRAEEYRELDEERVLVLSHWGGRGKTSGLELGRVSTKSAAVFYVRDGKVAKLILHLDRERALADLGLAE